MDINDMAKSYFSLHDEIVTSSLDSLTTLGSDGPIVVGGLAVQIHAVERNSRCRFAY